MKLIVYTRLLFIWITRLLFIWIRLTDSSLRWSVITHRRWRVDPSKKSERKHKTTHKRGKKKKNEKERKTDKKNVWRRKGRKRKIEKERRIKKCLAKKREKKRKSEKERRIKKMFGEEKSSHVVASSKKGRKKFPVENIWPHLMRSRDWKWQKWFRHRSKKIHHVKWTPFSLVSFTRAGGKGEKSNSFRLTERVFICIQPANPHRPSHIGRSKEDKKKTVWTDGRSFERTADNMNGRTIVWTDGRFYERTANSMNERPFADK